MDICVGSWSQGVLNLSPVAFIRPKQTKIRSCGGRALHMNGGTYWMCDGKNGLHPRVTQLILSTFVPATHEFP